jgi:tetratricopeptide (TPR) repeat protein
LAGDAYYFADRCPEAVASYRKVFDAAPRDPSVQVDYGAVLLACAPEQATEDLFAPLVETLDKTRGKNDLDTALALDNLAEFYTQTNLAADAIQYRTTAIEAFDKAIGGEHPAVASSLVRLAASCNRLGLKEEALEYLTLARQIREQGVGPRHPSVAEAYWLTARTERALARNKAAADHLKLAQDIDPRVDAVGFSGVRLARTTASGPERQEPPVTRKPDPVQDAWKLMSEKRYVEAEMLLRGEIARLRYADASEDSALIPVWDVLQTVYRMQGKREKEYQDVAREVREIYIAGQVRRLEARTAPLNKSVVDEYLRLADGYAGDHLDAQAEPLYRKAIELHGIVAGGTSCEMVDTLGRYRRFLSIRGREDEARVIVDRIRTTQRSCRESAPPPRRRGW